MYLMYISLWSKTNLQKQSEVGLYQFKVLLCFQLTQQKVHKVSNLLQRPPCLRGQAAKFPIDGSRRHGFEHIHEGGNWIEVRKKCTVRGG